MLRTTMGEDRLCDLAILSIEKDMTSIILDYDEIINDFASADNNHLIVNHLIDWINYDGCLTVDIVV